jgi:undecaprenyl-diphosphatase
MIPVVILGLLLSEKIQSLFTGKIKFVGAMLLVTAILLLVTRFVPTGNKPVTFKRAFLIGVAQALAVLPGISRSGSTISTALFLGTEKKEAARFSFLMVLLPIIAVNTKELISTDLDRAAEAGTWPLVIGFSVAFISGLAACKWMIRIVQRGNLFYFSLYCFILGMLAIVLG